MNGVRQNSLAAVKNGSREILANWEASAHLSVSEKPIRPVDLLPIVHSLSDRLVAAAIDDAEASGEKVSCRQGCAACCRQMVPISEVEARRIRDVVQALPEPRRTEILKRFAEARRWLETAGLLPVLQNTDDWNEGARPPHGWIYHVQGIACPFLEDESCSIYADRPIACREYLVTSPAEHCTNPSVETVRCVNMFVKLWPALTHFDEVEPTARNLRWVPLILAPEWADAHREEPAPRAGAELLQELIENLTASK